jgi:hypothetical protein
MASLVHCLIHKSVGELVQVSWLGFFACPLRRMYDMASPMTKRVHKSAGVAAIVWVHQA